MPGPSPFRSSGPPTLRRCRRGAPIATTPHWRSRAPQLGLPAAMIAAAEGAARETRAATGLTDEQLTRLRRQLWKTVRAAGNERVIKPLSRSMAVNRVVDRAMELAVASGSTALGAA